MGNQANLKYRINYQIDQSSFNKALKSLQDLQKAGRQKILDDTGNEAQIKNGIALARELETALRKAYNPKLGITDIKKFYDYLNQTASTLPNISRGLLDIGTTGSQVWNHQISQILKVQRVQKESHKVLEQMADTLAKTARWSVSSSLIHNFTNSIRSAYNYTKALDSSLNDIRIVTGKSTEEMSQFAKEANKAAQQLGVSTTAYTDASLIYYQQGLAENEVKARTEITAKVANVTRQSADKVSEQLTAIWNGYKVSAEEAEIYIDRLSAIAANSASNLEELATGMSKVASAAAALGVNENQLAAMLSTIESVTRQAPESVGTALRTVFARISDIEAGLDEDTTLGNYSAEMAKLGINVLDTNNKLRNMGDVIEEIGGKWASMTREQQINLAQTMAGQRQYSNVVALFDSFDKYNNMIQVAEDSMGTLNKQQDIYLDRTTAKTQKLNAALEGIWNSLINQDDMKGLIDSLTDVAELTKEIIDSLGGGRQIFMTLSTLAVSLFSNHLAKGLSSTIENLHAASQRAEDFKNKLAEGQKILQDQNLSQEAKSIIETRNFMNKFGARMSKEDYDLLQQQLKDYLAKLDEVSEKSEAFNKVKTKAKEAEEEIKKLTTRNQELINQLSNYSSKISDINTKQSEFIKSQINSEGVVSSVYNQHSSNIDSLYNNRDAIAEDIKNSSSSTKESILALGEKLTYLPSDWKAYDKSNYPSEDLNNSTPDKKDIQALNEQLNKRISQSISKKQELLTTEGVGFNALHPEINDKFSNLQSKLLTQTGRPTTSKDALNKVLKEYKELLLKIDTAIKEYAQETQNTIAEEIKETIEKAQEEIQQAKNEAKTVSKEMQENQNNINYQKQENQNNEENARAEEEAAREAARQEATRRAEEQRRIAQELTIQNYIKTAAAVGTLTSSMSQLSNISSILHNDSLSAGQRILQVVTNLSFSVPLLVKSLGTLATGFKIVKLETAQTAKLFDLANGKLVLFGKTVTLTHPILATLVVATTAAIGVALHHIEVMKQQSQNHLKEIENNKKEAESKKEENKVILDAVKKLQELNQQYKEGIITKKEFETQSQKIIDANNLERESLDKLTNSYYDNKKAIYEVYKTKIDSQLANQKTILGSGEDIEAIITNAWNNQGIYEEVAKTPGTIGRIESSANKRKIGVYGNNDQIYHFTIDTSTKQAFNESYQRIIKGYQTLPDGSAKSQEAPAIMTIKNMLGSAVDETKKAIQDTKELITSKAIQVGYNQNSDIQDFSDYQNIVEKVLEVGKEETEKIGQFNYDEEFQNKIIHSIRQKYSENQDLLSYETLYQYIKNNKDNEKDAINYFNQLTSDQKGHFVDFISQNQINDAEQLKTIFEQIRDMDFTSEMARVNTVNLEKLKSLAAEDYLLYKGIEEQVENGKNLNTSEYKKLNEEVQKFFTMSANGTYQFTGNVNEFKEAVRQFQTVSALDLRDQINNRINQLNALLQQARNFKGGPEAYSDYIFDGKINDKKIDYSDKVQMDKLTKARVDYLAANGNEQGIIWKKAMENGLRLTSEEEKQIAQIISATQKFVYDKVQQEAEELTQKLPQVTTMLFRQLIPVDSDVDNGQLNNFTNMLQQVADAMDEFSDGLETNREAAELTAQALLRYNSAAQSWMKNYQSWSETLNSNNLIEFSKIAPQLRNVYSDLLGITGDDLSNKFLASKTNFAELQKALTGTEEEAEAAYNALMKLAAEDINAKFNFETQDLAELQTWVDEFNAYFDDEEHSLEARVNFDDTDALKGLEQFANKYGMTAQQIRDYALTNFGIDLEVNQVAPEKTTETIYGYNTKVTPVPVSGVLPNVGGTEEQNIIGGVRAEVEPIATQITNTISSPARAVKVISGGKAVGGKTKYGMATPTSKKLSGSSSKSYSKKQNNKKPDIYHDVNTRLDQSKRRLQRTQDKESKLIGKDLVKNLNDQMILYRQQKNILEEKLKLQKQDLANQRKTLKQLGVQFDAYGNISNYVTILQTKNKRINELIARRNALIDNGNEASQKQVEALDKQIAEEEASYSKYESLMNAYTTDNNSIEDTKDAIQEQVQKQIEIKIKKAKMKVDLQLDLHEAKKEWQDFVRNVVNHDSLLKTTNFDKIIKDASNAYALAFNTNVKESASAIIAGTGDIINAYNQMQKTGTSDLFGSDWGALQTRMKQLQQQGYSLFNDYYNYKDQIDQAVLDSVDALNEAFDAQIDKLQFIHSQYSKDIDLIKLVYGEQSYDSIMAFQEKQGKNYNEMIRFQRKRVKQAQEEYKKAMADGDTELAKKWEQIWKQSIDNVSNYVNDAIKQAQEARDTANAAAAKRFEDSLTGGEGFDYLKQRWNLLKENSQEYLDTVNRAYSISSVDRKYQDAINGTLSVKNQRELNKLKQDEINKLKTKENLSKYDVQRAEKVLDIKKAEMALQDARMSKTQMRLKRDSQGNYSYEYIADTSKISAAEQNVEKAKNDLYNFDLNQYKHVYDKILNIYSEYSQKMIEIENDTSLTEEQKQQRKRELYEQTTNQIKAYSLDYNTVAVNLAQSAVDSIKKIQEGQVKDWVEKHVPGMNAGSQEIINKLVGDKDTIEAALKTLDKQVKHNTGIYKYRLKTIEKASGTSFDNIKKGMDPVTQAYKDIIANSDTLFNDITNKYKEVKNKKTAFDAMDQKMEKVLDKLKTGLVRVALLTQGIDKINADALDKDNGKGSGKTGEQYNTNKTFVDSTNTGGGGNTGNGDKPSLEKRFKGNTPKPEPKPEPTTIKDILVSGGKAAIAAVQASGIDKKFKGTLDNAKSPVEKKDNAKSPVEKKTSDFKMSLQDIINSKGTSYSDDREKLKKLYNRYSELFSTNGQKPKYENGIPTNLTENWTPLLIQLADRYIIPHDPFDSRQVEAEAKNTNYTIQKFKYDYMNQNLSRKELKEKLLRHVTNRGTKNILDTILNTDEKEWSYIGFNTGGYTGVWHSQQGKLAMLHEKELVLNKKDTENMLKMLEVSRAFSLETVINRYTSRLESLNSKNQMNDIARNVQRIRENLEQMVTIQASFPAVNSRLEIEEALKDLINITSQKIMSKK